MLGEPVRLIETSMRIKQGATRSERRAAFENRLYQIFRRDGFEPRRLPQTELESRLAKSRRWLYRFLPKLHLTSKETANFSGKASRVSDPLDFEFEKRALNIAVRIYKKYQSELEKQESLISTI